MRVVIALLLATLIAMIVFRIYASVLCLSEARWYVCLH